MSKKQSKVQSIVYKRIFYYFLIALAAFLILPYIFYPVVNYFFPKKHSLPKAEIVLAPFEERLVLIGDAGRMNSNVSSALKEMLAAAPKNTSIIYLGDNIYSRGIPPESNHEEWQTAVERLYRQIDPFITLTKQIYFVPGNHDWDFHGKDGWNAVKREEALVNQKLGPNHFAPPGGCPGPQIISISSKLRVIALDSHWWTHQWEKPSTPQDGCSVYTKEGVLTELSKILADSPAGVTTIVAQHYPLVGYGSHVMNSSCPADMGCPEYTDMKNRMLEVMNKYRPVLCVAGHDHGMQVLRLPSGCMLDVVSGGGTEIQRVLKGDGTLYAEDKLGFMLLDRQADNSLVLSVVEVPSSGKYASENKWHVVFSRKL